MFQHSRHAAIRVYPDTCEEDGTEESPSPAFFLAPHENCSHFALAVDALWCALLDLAIFSFSAVRWRDSTLLSHHQECLTTAAMKTCFKRAAYIYVSYQNAKCLNTRIGQIQNIDMFMFWDIEASWQRSKTVENINTIMLYTAHFTTSKPDIAQFYWEYANPVYGLQAMVYLYCWAEGSGWFFLSFHDATQNHSFVPDYLSASPMHYLTLWLCFLVQVLLIRCIQALKLRGGGHR